MIFGQRLERDEARQLWDLDLLTLGAAADGCAAASTRRPGDLRHRPQHQLHQHLYLGLPFLRLLPASRRQRRLRPGLGRLAAKLEELKDHGGSGVLLRAGSIRSWPRPII